MRITNEDLVEIFGFPEVCIRNTYFWGGRFDRGQFAEKQVQEFVNALKKLIEIANANAKAEVEVKANSVYFTYKNIKYFVFHFSQSRRHTYKNQDLKPIKNFIKEHYDTIISHFITEKL